MARGWGLVASGLGACAVGLVGALGLVGFVGAAAPAGAHARLVGSTPEDGSTVRAGTCWVERAVNLNKLLGVAGKGPT